MSTEKRIEQEIGWLKIIFAILFASDISLFVWVFQNFDKVGVYTAWSSLFGVVFITFILSAINFRVYKYLNQLEEL